MANKKVERKKKADPKYLEKKKARVEKKNWFDAKETKVAEKRAKKEANEKKYKNKLFYPAKQNERDWMLSLKPEDLVPENPSLRFYFQPRMKFDNFDNFYQLQKPKVNFHAWVEDENGKVICKSRTNKMFNNLAHIESQIKEIFIAMNFNEEK